MSKIFHTAYVGQILVGNFPLFIEDVPKYASFTTIIIISLSLASDDMDTISGFNQNKRIVIPMCNGRIRDLYDLHYPFNIEF